MDYYLRKSLLLLLAVVTTGVLRAQFQFGVVLEESFEDGSIPEGWVTEHVKGSQDWIVERGGRYPDNAYIGEYRLAFRNTSNVSGANVSRLVLPEIDVTELFQPMLCIAFAQDKWTNDFDMLRILIRSDKNSSWQEIKRYTEYVSYWKTDTIFLENISSTYQIAFEGTDNLGRGIVLDNIVIRSAPYCTRPFNLRTDTVKNDGVVLKWAAGIDALNYRVCVGSVALTTEQLASGDFKADIFDEFISGNRKECVISDLKPGVTYYACIQSECLTEKSEWSDVLEFETTNLVDIPYFENFNMEYTGEPSQSLVWRYGTSIDKYLVPFINTNSKDASKKKFSRDTTTCLVFSSKNQDASNIPGKEYAYAATPELNVSDISKLTVRFWSRSEYKTQSDINRIIVGVMTNSEDFNTFVPVDTVKMADRLTFEEFIVPLDKYKGTGKYVALVSDFPVSNQFYIDDLSIFETPDLRCEKNFKVAIPAADKIVVSWDRHGAATGDVVISTSAFERDAVPAGLMKSFNSSTYEFVAEPGKDYYVCVRNSTGDRHGEWSEVRKVRTPLKYEMNNLPVTLDFEVDKNDKSTYYYPRSYSKQGDAYMVPVYCLTLGEIFDHDLIYAKSITSERGKYEMVFSLYRQWESAYVVFPELPGDIKTLRASFWSKSQKTETVSFEAGIMSDANDTATFVPLDTIVAPVKADDYEKFYVPFDKYNGTGKFFAVRVKDYDVADATVKIDAYIDNLTFEVIPECKEASNIVVSPNDASAEFTWDANGTTKWRLRVYMGEVPYDSLSSTTYQYDYVYDMLSDSSHVIVSGLNGNVNTYYYTVQTVCDGVSGDWSAPKRFDTKCYEKNPVPYVQNFDNYVTGSKAAFQVPCMYSIPVKDGTNYYPNVSTSKKHNGKASLAFDHKSEDGKTQYLILPEMERPLNELQLVMFVNSASLSALEVGTVQNTGGLATYDSVTTVMVEKTGTWQEVAVLFSKTKVEHKHIVLRTPNVGGKTVYVDSLVVREKDECAWVQTPSIKSTKYNSAIATWTGDSETKWDIVVTTKIHTDVQLDAVMAAVPNKPDNVVFNGTVESNPYTITDLAPSTQYYYYVRANCGEGQTGRWSVACKFMTDCEFLNVGDLGVETFEKYGFGGGKYPTCWKAGNMDGSTSATYVPFITTGGCTADGKYALKIQSDPTPKEKANGAYIASPMLDIDDISKLQVHFFAELNSSYATSVHQKQLIVGVATDLTDYASYVPVDTIDGYIGGKYYTVPLERYNGDYNEEQGKYVVFISRFEKKNHIMLDDIWFDTIPECKYPGNVAFTELTDTSVRISWNVTNAPYKVKIANRMLSDKELDVTEENAGVMTYSTDKTFIEVEGLDFVTTYYVYLQGACTDGSVSDWSDPYIVTTKCPENYELPYEMGFDDALLMPDCWTAFYTEAGNEAAYPVLSTFGDRGGKGQGWKFNTSKKNEKTYAVMPAMDIDNISDCQVSFYASLASKYNACSVILGVVSDNSTQEKIIETFEPVDTATINKEDGFFKFNVSLRNYNGSGKYIAFRTESDIEGNTDGAIYLDDIKVIKRPVCAEPDYLSYVSSTDTSVILMFTDYAYTDEWEIRYGDKGFVPDDNGISVICNSTTDTVYGLDDATVYDFYVRAVCNAGTNYSGWVGPLTVKTKPTPINVFPYVNGFDNERENNAWIFDNDTNAWCIGNAYPHDKDGMSMYISYDHGESAVIKANNLSYKSYSFAYRPIELKVGEYHFEFDWIGEGKNSSEYMRVGLVPVDAKFGHADGKIYLKDKQICDLGSSYAKFTEEYIPLEGVNDRGEPILQMNGAKDWTHQYVSYIVTEAKSGLYNFVVFWYNNTDYSSTPKVAPSMVFDNLNIEYIPCASPVLLALDDVSDSTATITWQPVGKPQSYDIFVTANDLLDGPYDALSVDTAFYMENIIDSVVVVTCLAANTAYYAFVRSVCADGAGPWSAPVSFETMCAVREPGSVIGFEPEEGYYIFYENGRYQYWMTDCMVRLHPTLDLTQYLANNNYNSGCVRGGGEHPDYAHNGLYSLFFSSNSESNKGGCVVLPAFNAQLDTMQLTFWMRPFAATYAGGGTINGSGMKYAKSITVGSLTKPNDLSTFEPIKTVTYPYTEESFAANASVLNDPNGNAYWVKFSVPLEGAKGKYLAFRNDGFDGVNNNIYIDDVVLERIAPEYPPYKPQVSDVKQSSAYFTWQADGGDRWIVHLSTKPNMSDTVLLDTVSVKEYDFNMLQPGTEYYFSVRTYTDATGVASDAVTASCLTPYRLCFAEDFNAPENIPKHWFMSKISAEGVFKGSVMTPGVSSWSHVYEGGGMSGGHMKVGSVGGASKNEWIVTPVMQLNDAPVYTLTFDLALNDAGTSDPMTWNDYGSQEKTFLVAVSDDAGNTWKKENATIWCNRPGEYDYYFDSIPYIGQRYTIDLSAYKGKHIRIGFYIGTKWDNASVDIHLDNVRVNAAVTENHSVGLCETEDFRGYGLDLKDTELSMTHDNVYENYMFSTDKDKPDTMQTVIISVDPLRINPVHGIICRGGRYNEDGFDLTEAGVYKKKIRSEAGCDSVVELTLEIIEPAVSIIVDSMCEGYTYMWGGKEYSRPGIYQDTLSMAGLECDSIATLVLSVIPVKVNRMEKTVCFNESYLWGDTTLTTSGLYRRRFTTDMCDSIVELKFNVNPEYRKTYREVICRGETFTGYGFKDVFGEGEHTLPLMSNEGCDSTVVLILTEIGGDTTYVFNTVKNDELPYTYLDLYYDENTYSGTYIDTLTVENENCKSTIIHTLVVEKTIGVEVVAADIAFKITPNPVNAGSEITLDIDLTPDELVGATVCLYSSMGALVRCERVLVFGDIRIRCDVASGVYGVRLVTATGRQYHGRIIVK